MGTLRHECITSVPNNQILVAGARVFASWLLLLFSISTPAVPGHSWHRKYLMPMKSADGYFPAWDWVIHSFQVVHPQGLSAGVLTLISGSVYRRKPVWSCFGWTHFVLALVGTFCWLRSLVWWSLDLTVVDLCCFRRLHMALNITLPVEVLKFCVSSFVFWFFQQRQAVFSSFHVSLDTRIFILYVWLKLTKTILIF